MCINHYEYAKGPSRLTTLRRNTGTKDLSFDPDAAVNQNPRMRPGYDPRFPDRQDDTEVMRQAQEIPRVSPSMEWEMYSRYDERDRDQGYQYDRRSDADRIYGGYTGRVTGNYNFELPSLTPGRFFDKPTPTSQQYSGGQDYSRQRY